MSDSVSEREKLMVLGFFRGGSGYVAACACGLWSSLTRPGSSLTPLAPGSRSRLMPSSPTRTHRTDDGRRWLACAGPPSVLCICDRNRLDGQLRYISRCLQSRHQPNPTPARSNRQRSMRWRSDRCARDRTSLPSRRFGAARCAVRLPFRTPHGDRRCHFRSITSWVRRRIDRTGRGRVRNSISKPIHPRRLSLIVSYRSIIASHTR